MLRQSPFVVIGIGEIETNATWSTNAVLEEDLDMLCKSMSYTRIRYTSGMGVVLKPMQGFLSIRVTSADMDVYVLLQWRKAVKGRRKVRERSEYHYL